MIMKEKIKSMLLSLRFFINNNPRLKKAVIKVLDRCPIVESKFRKMWHANIFKLVMQPPYGKRAMDIYRELK